MGAAYVMGIPVLSLIYGVELGHLKLELLVILIGGGFNAVVNMLYYVLTALRMQKNILISYVVVSLVAYVIASWSVKRWELMGAVCAYVVLMCLLAVWMTISMYRCIARQKC